MGIRESRPHNPTNRQNHIVHIQMMSNMLKYEVPTKFKGMKSEDIKEWFLKLRGECREKGIIKS